MLQSALLVRLLPLHAPYNQALGRYLRLPPYLSIRRGGAAPNCAEYRG